MTYEYEQYLAHHGIKGQKWGVRRYQNEDGSLTEEGLKRYKKSEDLLNKYRETKREAYSSYLNNRKWRSLEKKADRYAAKASKISTKVIDRIDTEKYRKSILGDKDYNTWSKSRKIIDDEYEKFKGDQKAKTSAAKKLLDRRIEFSKKQLEKGYDYKYYKDNANMTKKAKKAWVNDMVKAFDYSIDAHDDLWFTHVESIPKYKKAEDTLQSLRERFNDMPYGELLKYYS